MIFPPSLRHIKVEFVGHISNRCHITQYKLQAHFILILKGYPQNVRSDKYDDEYLEINKSFLTLCLIIVDTKVLKLSGHAINLLA